MEVGSPESSSPEMGHQRRSGQARECGIVRFTSGYGEGAESVLIEG